MTTDSTTIYSVTILPDAADAIDYAFSGPADGLVALSQIHAALPMVHRPRLRRWWRSGLRSVPVYHGLIEWADLAFSYIQHGNQLCVLNGWCRSEYHSRLDRPIDVVLPNVEIELRDHYGNVEKALACGGEVC